MKIIIVGAGSYGSMLTQKLISEQNDIVVIDTDPNKVKEISDRFDLKAIQGSGTNYHDLERAGVKNADMYFAMTGMDEINLISCMMVKSYNIKTKVARINNPGIFDDERGTGLEDFNIDLVLSPELLVARELKNLLMNPGANNLYSFHEDKAQIFSIFIQPNNPLVNKKIKDLPRDYEIQIVRFVAIERNHVAFIPRGDTTIKSGDNLYVIGASDRLKDFLSWCGSDDSKLQSIVISGAGSIGLHLAKSLEDSDVRVRLVERNIELAQTASALLDDSLVLHGDITEKNFQQSINMENVDIFIGASSDDENNILSCVLAKQSGAKKTVALISKTEYVDIVNSMLRVDTAINPMISLVNSVLHFLRKGQVQSATSLSDLDAEVLEFKISSDSKINGVQIKEMDFPKNAVIGVVIRQDEIIPATGNLALETDDLVLVLALSKAVNTIEKYFARRKVSLFQ